MDIGIDLGTTFSVMAVKGRVQLAQGYPEGVYLEECDVTIIPTPFGELSVPSVFWANPENPAEVLVGSEAKQKAEEGDWPIMFSKRCIGTDEPLRLHDRTYTAKEVATHILKYLKDCAERALGQPVQRAVVTHPAYFDRNQVEETREAAVAAGFDMALPEQLMMEPAAAALAFIQGDQRDPLRVLTYDLGGGTFDVTVLERREGVITMKAFDGDHLLGGYNFDRELVQWLLDRVKATGRTIPYDENNPEDRGRRARMLQLAEKIKIQLSEQRGPKVAVPIKAQDILVDSEGKNVQILERITREQYAELIKEHLDKTIACCHSALGKAGMQLQEIDVVLLVGGSTFGQWVTEVVNRALGVEAQLFNPDLLIAAGAALAASELPEVQPRTLVLRLEAPPYCRQGTVSISGFLSASPTLAASGLSVELHPHVEGLTARQNVEGSGAFCFELVPLHEGANKFRLRVLGKDNRPLLNHTFQIERPHTVIRAPSPADILTARFARRDLVNGFRSSDRVLGQGINSVVFEGEAIWGQHRVRPVALKVQGPLTTSAEADSFLRGPLALQRLWDAAPSSIRARLTTLLGIGTITDAQETYGWQASEIVWGQRLDSLGPLPVAYCLNVVLQLTDILSFAHALRPPVVHGDLHCGNIVVQADGLVRLFDLGSREGTVRYFSLGADLLESLSAQPERIFFMTTPREYVSPELAVFCVGASPTAYEAILKPSMDVFSVGVILYRLLTGRLPSKSSPEGGCDFTEFDKSIRGAFSHDLKCCLTRCLSPHESDRPQNGQALHDELRGIQRTLRKGLGFPPGR